MKGRCLNRLTTEPDFYSRSVRSTRFENTSSSGRTGSRLGSKIPRQVYRPPRVGLEPTTPRLTAACSTIELSRNVPSKPHTKTIQTSFGQAFDRLVTFSSMHYCTYTYDLSTLSSSRGLINEGYLILRGASRLDAFSVYPFRTWLLCDRIGS